MWLCVCVKHYYMGYVGVTVDEFRDSSLKRVMICAHTVRA